MARYLIKKTDIRGKSNKWVGANNEFILEIVKVEGCAFGWPIIVGWYDDKAWMKFTHKRLIVNLNDCFRHWQNPTKVEVDMFEMMIGEKYLTHYLGLSLCEEDK